jgi:hypothetical protein
MNRSPSVAARCRFTPRVEALEDRCLPSCTAVQAGSVLTITANNQQNKVVVSDNGLSNALDTITATCDGAAHSFNGVAQVVISVQGVKDTVSYTLPNGLQMIAFRTVDVNLRGRNDTFSANVAGNLLPDAHLVFNVRGGAGNDKINLAVAGNLAAMSSLVFDAQGGKGTNSMRATVTGNLGGNPDEPAVLDVNCDASSGHGHNTITEVLNGFLNYADATLSATGAQSRAASNTITETRTGNEFNSNTNVSMDETGGAGNDVLRATILGDIGDETTLSLNQRGQAGNDLLFANYQGTVHSDGTLAIAADGGPGNDKVVVRATLNPAPMTSPLAGKANIVVDGGPGNDDLTLAAHDAGIPIPLQTAFFIDGGPGHNTCRATSNVTEINCQVHVLLP